MNDQPAIPCRPGEVAALWWGWLGAPSWWLTQFEIRYAFVPWACSHGHRWMVLGLGAVALAGSLALAIWAWWSLKKTRGGQPLSFLRLGAAWSATFFALLVLAQMLPDLFLDPCRR